MTPAPCIDSETGEPDEYAHHWVFVRDWYGDPTIPYGTADCSFYRCQHCGEERHEKPDSYIGRYDDD